MRGDAETLPGSVQERCTGWFRGAWIVGMAIGWPVLGTVSGAAADPDPVAVWNVLLLDAVRMDNSGPTLSSRNLALYHTAIFDAVNGLLPRYQAYWPVGAGPTGADADAALGGAAQRVVSLLYPGMAARARGLLAESQERRGSEGVTQEAWDAGVEWGRQVADVALVGRQNDGANTLMPYIPNLEPGQWRRTPPDFRPPVDPHWRRVRLFCLPSTEPYLPPPPPSLDSEAYARDWDEVRRLGARDSGERSAEESLIADFWSDFSYTAMPPGHWHEIVQDLVARHPGWDRLQVARLYALVSLAQADVAIVCWEAKYRHHLWRPVTAIRLADQDGNTRTDRDPEWTDYLAAPPFPEYPSGHSSFSWASAEVLRLALGTDQVTFEVRSDSVAGVVRSFDRLSDCAREVGRSRIFGGIHFQFGNEGGRVSGQRVGWQVAGSHLIPLEELPRLRIRHGYPGESRAFVVWVDGREGEPVLLLGSKDLVHWEGLGEWNCPRGGLEWSPPEEWTFLRVVPGRE